MKHLLFLVFAVAFNSSADELIIKKAERHLEFKSSESLRVFRIALGTDPVHRKMKQGDRRTPEGVYYITHKNPRSQFYLSLGIGYPNISDGGFNSGMQLW